MVSGIMVEGYRAGARTGNQAIAKRTSQLWIFQLWLAFQLPS